MTDGRKMVWAAAYIQKLHDFSGDGYPSTDAMHSAAEFASTIVEDLVEQAPIIAQGFDDDSSTALMLKLMVES